MTEINNNEILFKLKGAGISCFCQRRVSPQEDPEKRRCFGIFLTTNSLTLTEAGTLRKIVTSNVKQMVYEDL